MLCCRQQSLFKFQTNRRQYDKMYQSISSMLHFNIAHKNVKWIVIIAIRVYAWWIVRFGTKIDGLFLSFPWWCLWNQQNDENHIQRRYSINSMIWPVLDKASWQFTLHCELVESISNVDLNFDKLWKCKNNNSIAISKSCWNDFHPVCYYNYGISFVTVLLQRL